jgi:hypothetical protein
MIPPLDPGSSDRPVRLSRRSIDEILLQDPGTALESVHARLTEPARAVSQSLGLRPGGVQLLKVATGAYTFCIGVNSRAVNDRLVVMFHGARDNSDAEWANQASFKRLTWSGPLGAAVLSISDPLTDHRWATAAPRCTLYAGRIAQDPDDEINALIDQVAAELGVPPNGVVLYGGSAGGSAAMRIGSRRPQGRIIASNAMVHLPALPRQFFDAWLYAGAGTRAELAGLHAHCPWRLDAVLAFERGLAAGHDLRLLVMQARGDRRAFHRHWPKMCEHFGVNPATGGVGAAGRVLLALHEGRNHAIEPTFEMHALADALFALPPEAVAGATLPGLMPGSWTFPPEATMGLMRPLNLAADEDAGQRTDEQAGDDTVARLPALAAPATAGALWFTGSVGADLLAPLKLLASLTDVAVDETDDDVPKARAPQAMLAAPAWRVASVRCRSAALAAVFEAPVPARLVCLVLNPVDAMAVFFADAAPADETRLAEAVQSWNKSMRKILQLSPRYGERILPMALEDFWGHPPAREGLLAWMGRAPTKRFESRLARQTERLARQTSRPAWLDALACRRILAAADMSAYHRLLGPREQSRDD